MKQTLLTTFVLALILALATTEAAAKTGDWKRLGQKEADLRVDRDAIAVGVDEGFFKSIKLTVLKANVEFIKVRVVCSSGRRGRDQAGGSDR